MSEGTPMLYRFSLRGMCAMALTQRLFWDAEIKCLQPLRMCSYFIFFSLKTVWTVAIGINQTIRASTTTPP